MEELEELEILHSYSREPTRRYMCDHVTMNFRRDITILLVGTTGVGKSTFGNFLTGTKPPPFYVSHSCMAGTTQPQSDGFFLRGIDRMFRIIDTPGVNDINDLENMKKLGEEISSGHVHCVVLCVAWGTRDDVNTRSTIEFYRELLLPVVRAGNVVLVITKCPLEIFTKLKDVEKKKTELEEMVTSILGHKIGTVEVTNAGQINQNQEIYRETKDARDRILRMASEFKPLNLDCRIPLPPYFRSKQEVIARSIEREIKQIEKHIADLNENLPQTFAKLKQDHQQESNNLNLLETTLQEKSQTQRSPSFYAKGNTLINLGRFVDKYIKIPITDLNITMDSIVWNCDKPTIKWSESDNGMITIYFDVVPNFITFSKNSLTPNEEPQTWFAVVWVTSNLGTESELKDLREEIKEKKKILSDLLTKLNKCKKQMEEGTVQKFKELKESNRKLTLMKKRSFSLKEIDEVEKILKEF